MIKNRIGCARTILLLSAAYLTVWFSPPAESSLVLKKDPITNEAALVEEGTPDEERVGTQENDHVSGDALPTDKRFKQYIRLVDDGAGDMKRSRYDQAIEKLKQAILLEPSMPYAYDNLANAYYHLLRYGEAIEMSRNALKADPQDANAYGNLGSIYYALKKYPEAKENYQKARELFQKKGDPAGVSVTDKYLAQAFSD